MADAGPVAQAGGMIIRRRRRKRGVCFWDVCSPVLGEFCAEALALGSPDSKTLDGEEAKRAFDLARSRGPWQVVEVAVIAESMSDEAWNSASLIRVGDVVRCEGVVQRAGVSGSDEGSTIKGAEGASPAVVDGGMLQLRSLLQCVRWRDVWPGRHFSVVRDVPEEVARAHVRAGRGTDAGDAPADGAEAHGGAGGDATDMPAEAPAERVCRFWVTTGECYSKDDCAFSHPTGDALRAARRAYSLLRRSAKDERNAIDGDPHAATDKGAKGTRARALVDFLVAEFGGLAGLRGGSGVVDVAGGRGGVAFELQLRRGVRCTLVDPRPLRLDRAQHKWLKKQAKAAARRGEAASEPELPTQLQCLFDESFAADKSRGALLRACSVVVGLHPDQATDAIVDVAVALRRPFAVVPCCVFAREFPHRALPDGGAVRSYEELCDYLCAKAPGVRRAFLPFSGKNQVLYWKPDG